MNPAEHHIEVKRNARYVTLGELNEDTKSIWILIHGHKQLAKDFILSFKELAEEGNFLIAPEGLMRLYIKGDYGDVGASWMTKEDRESDIKDYVNYLDKLFFEVIKPSAEKFNLKINALGFSQGVATLSRWLSLGKSKVDKAVFWTGSVAHDVDYSKSDPETIPYQSTAQGSGLKQTEIYQVFGSNDPYFPKKFSEEQVKVLKQANLNSKTFIFEGEHEVSVKLMREAGVI